MKFSGYHVNSNEFHRMLGSGTFKIRFEQAFASKNKGTHPSPLILQHRQWIEDVIEIFAHKLDITKAQAIHAVKTGAVTAIREIYRRRLNKFAAHSRFTDKEEEEYMNLDRMVKMEPEHFYDMVRNHWLWALSLRHPMDKISNANSVKMTAEELLAILGMEKTPTLTASFLEATK